MNERFYSNNKYYPDQYQICELALSNNDYVSLEDRIAVLEAQLIQN